MESKITPHQQPSSGRSKPARYRSVLGRHIVIVAAVAVLLIIGAVSTLQIVAANKPASDRYQAVFLDNGQVFFGKLKNTNGSYLTLDKAYYTQKQDVPADASAQQKAATDNNVSLIKVGDEVYGPESTMRIKSEQVLFWQNLKADSKVAKAIDSAK